jgi:hypothetical protein
MKTRLFECCFTGEIIFDANNCDYLEENKENEGETNDKIHGIHPEYKKAINKMFFENPRIQPIKILRMLFRRNDEFDMTICRPDLTQIHNYKRTLNKNNKTNEIEPVEEYLNNFKFVKGKQIGDCDTI